MGTETAPFPAGTLLRVTETHMPEGCGTVHKGIEFEVDIYVDESESDTGHAYYWGDDKYGSSVSPDADKVELVKTAEQMYARRIPTAEEIIAELHCLEETEDFEITEADRPEGASREISGVTKDGLFFACTITVSNVYQGDF